MTRFASLTLIALVASGCGDVTELVVVVDTDMNVPAELDAVEIRVTGPSGMQVNAAGSTGADGALVLPTVLGLTPGGSVLEPVLIEARGSVRGTLLLERRVRTGFVEGEIRMVRLDLLRACSTVSCGSDEQTCTEGGCRPIDVPGASLPTWRGQPERLDASVAGDACTGREECNERDDDCDGFIDEGFDTTVDPDHCGTCGNACGEVANGSTQCARGLCTIRSCEPGFENCDGAYDNGCEANLQTPASCGGCDARCADGQLCMAVGAGAECVEDCRGGTTQCGDMCVDLMSNTSHCGRCDRSCPDEPGSERACVAGECGFTCDPGFLDCAAAPGCETPTDSLMHCGACDVACVRENATASCREARCTIGTCSAGFGNCNGVDADGCEQTLTTLEHCGRCGTACSRRNATASCDDRSCGIVACTAGFDDCDGVDDNGCEQSLSTLEHCGACARGCSLAAATATCASGACEIASCRAGFGDCDDMHATGCETDLAVDPDHCGACGTTCAWRQCAATVCTDPVGLAAGAEHTCATRAGGGLACWGNNEFLRLGVSMATRRRPTAVTTVSDATLAAAGRAHTCFARGSAAVRCVGLDDQGQLGDGTAGGFRSDPMDVAGVAGATSIAAGADHTCAVVDGAVRCWGDNERGQLGDGTQMNDRATAVEVQLASMAPLADAVQVAAGDGFSCARLGAGGVLCWGRDDRGQLGDDDALGDQPRAVGVAGITDAIDIGLGDAHGCAVRMAGGMRCWGANTNGAIGDGTSGAGEDRATPVAVMAIASATAVEPGGAHTCALLRDRTVSCWGRNGGALGDGATADRATPRVVPMLADVVEIAGGGSHTCARLASGDLRCWGVNAFGQLGDNSITTRTSPVAVLSP